MASNRPVTREEEHQREEAEREEHPTKFDKLKMKVDDVVAETKIKAEVSGMGMMHGEGRRGFVGCRWLSAREEGDKRRVTRRSFGSCAHICSKRGIR
jgi:hypothetical protein